MTITDLRALMERATPGPWAIANWGDVDDPHMVIEGPERPRPPTLRSLFWFGGQRAVDWGDEWNGDNAALIVAMHTMLPRLLAIVEAARAASLIHHGGGCLYPGGGPCDCGLPELREALKALEESPHIDK